MILGTARHCAKYIKLVSHAPPVNTVLTDAYQDHPLGPSGFAPGSAKGVCVLRRGAFGTPEDVRLRMGSPPGADPHREHPVNRIEELLRRISPPWRQAFEREATSGWRTNFVEAAGRLVTYARRWDWSGEIFVCVFLGSVVCCERKKYDEG